MLVLARANGNQSFDFGRNRDARIDGFTIRGADTGGGIIANGYTDYLQISNNRISNNQGFYGGGIRVGHPILIDPGTLGYTNGNNDHVSIHHNQVVFNGGLGRHRRRHLDGHRLRLVRHHQELDLRQLHLGRGRRHRPHRPEHS